MLAAIVENRACPRLAEEVDVLVDDAHPHQRPADDRELRIVDPPERDRRQRGRHDERQQHDGAQERLERQVLVEQQREPEAQAELDDARDHRVEDRVEQREARDLVAPEEFEVLEADPFAGAADLGVGEAEPRAEPERIGEEHQQQRRRGQHEQRARARAGCRGRGRARLLCGHQAMRRIGLRVVTCHVRCRSARRRRPGARQGGADVRRTRG